MQYKVTNKVPVPHHRMIYPFRMMEVGDSFLVPLEDLKNHRQVRSAASHFGRRNRPYRFSVIREKSGYRVFRIA